MFQAMKIPKNSWAFGIWFVCLLVLASIAPAQDDVRSVQEELRRRSLYFGDVNGRETTELREATKRYQQRKGFAVTGKPDRETLKSLGLVPRSAEEPPPPNETNWPDEPVLRSDEKIDAVAVADALSQETGIAPGAVVSKKLAQGTPSNSARRAAASADAGAANAAPPVAAGQKPKNSPVITPQALAKFASDYFTAMSSNDIKRQLNFYADNVRYFQNGSIDRRIIEQTLVRYQARWPNRRYTMGAQIRYGQINSQGEIVMSFPVTFTLKDGRRTVTGQTQNRLAISAATVDPRITSIGEQRIRR